MLVRFKGSQKKFPDLTRGNVYRVIGIEADDFRLMNDQGRPYLYPPKAFEIIDPSEPRDWVCSRGDSGERYAYPSALSKSGFWEDYFDDKASAVLKSAHLSGSIGEPKAGKTGGGVIKSDVLQQDISREDGRGLDIFVSGDQIRKGAATNAVQIAEKMF